MRLHATLFEASDTHLFPFWVPMRKELELHDESVHVAFELKTVVEGVSNERVLWWKEEDTRIARYR